MENQETITLNKKDCIKELIRVNIILNYGTDCSKPISFTAPKNIRSMQYGLAKFMIDIFSISKQEWDEANDEFSKEQYCRKT